MLSRLGSAREPNISGQPFTPIIWSPTASMRPSRENTVFLMGHLYELTETQMTKPFRATQQKRDWQFSPLCATIDKR